MINTGLPYDMELMNEAIEHGAVVDMSDIHFPSIPAENQSKTALIYLRNTGAENVTLDFAKCTYEQKADFLGEFIASDIYVELPDAINAWMEILLSAVWPDKEFKHAVFSDEQRQQFIRENKEVIDELLELLVSLPLFLIYKNKYVDLSEGDFKEDIVEHVADNYLQLLRHPLIEEIIFGAGIEPKFIKNIFTEGNNRLFKEIAEHLYFAALLYGMTTTDPKEWKKAMDDLNELQ